MTLRLPRREFSNTVTLYTIGELHRKYGYRVEIPLDKRLELPTDEIRNDRTGSKFGFLDYKVGNEWKSIPNYVVAQFKVYGPPAPIQPEPPYVDKTIYDVAELAKSDRKTLAQGRFAFFVDNFHFVVKGTCENTDRGYSQKIHYSIKDAFLASKHWLDDARIMSSSDRPMTAEDFEQLAMKCPELSTFLSESSE